MLYLKDIHVTFNAGLPAEVRALRGVNLAIMPHDFVTVIGANGAGKSTLFNVIAGTVPVERGSIRLADREITREAEYQRSRRIGRVFQNTAMGTCPGLTVLENLSLAAMRDKSRGLRAGVKRTDRAYFGGLLRDLGFDIQLDLDVALLSGGQRQAIALVMAILNQPELLLLDEHTAALDPNAAAQILNLTVRLALEHHLTVLMITHSMQQACEVGNRVVMMDRGQILLEVAGPERAQLTVATLIDQFKAVRAQEDLTDRLLLD